MNPRNFSKFNNVFLSLFLLVLDYAVVLFAEEAAALIRNALFEGEFRVPWLYFWLALPAPYLFFIWLARLYGRRMPFYREVEQIFYACLYATLTITFLLYAGKAATTTSRAFLMIDGVLAFVFLSVFRYLAKRYLIRHRLLLSPILIIGAGYSAELLVECITRDAGMGYQVVGLLEDNTPRPGILDNYPVLGRIDEAERVIRETGVRRVFIATPGMDGHKQGELIFRIQPLVDDIGVVPNLVGVPTGEVEAESFYDARLVVMGLKNNLRHPLNRLVKAVFDFTVTLAGTVAISPILLAIAIWVKCDSPGPVIFSHARIGKDGKPFGCLKFRTMDVNAKQKLEELLANDPEARAEWERDFKLKNDPRITRCGAFLRRTSLDELPQLFNVLAGQMSLVGPRPITAPEVERFGPYAKDRQRVRPGITGMWQVSGRSDVDYNERVLMDVWYVRNWSVWLDIVILFKTVRVVLKRDGAY